DGNTRRIGHELDDLQHLRPAGLVVVAHAERGGDREAAGPNAFEAGLFDDARAQAVVRFHEEFEAARTQELLELAGFAHAEGRLEAAGRGDATADLEAIQL